MIEKPFHGVQGVRCYLQKLGSRHFPGGEVNALPSWVVCWAEMGRAAGCSYSLNCSDSLWDLGNLVNPGRLKGAQP